MTDIKDMTDEQKSVLLIRMLKKSMLPGKYLPVDSLEFKSVGLYAPENMALAFKVARWMGQQGYDDLLRYWFNEQFLIMEETMQEQMLDKILTLLIGGK